MNTSDLHIEVDEATDAARWQENLSGCPYATVFQTYQWSRAYAEALRDIPLYMIVRDNSDTIVAQLLLFVVNEYERRLSPPYNRVLRFLPSRLGTGTKLVWSYGPLIYDKSQATAILRLILEEVDRLAKEWKVAQTYGTTPPLYDHAEECRGAYEQSSYRVVNWGTFVTDVTRSEETIWNGFDNKTRNDIRRAEKALIMKEVTNDGLLQKFASLSARFNELKRGRPNQEVAIRYYRTFWDNLHVSDIQPSPASTLFIAFQGEEARAGLMLNSFNGNVTQHSVISDGSKGNLGGPLLTWHAIKWAHSSGLETLDLVGVNPSPLSPEEKGIYFYKSRWGGTFRTQYNLIKVLKPLKTKVFAGYVMLQKRIWSMQGISP